MQNKVLSIVNLISVVFLIAWNAYANTGNYNGKTVGDLSAEYSNLFTPASYAFSIWGLIFLMLLVFGVYGVVIAFAKAKSTASSTELYKQSDYRTDVVKTTAPWFLLANIFCSAWVAFWLDEMLGISVICMLGILASLLVCVKKLDMEVWDAPITVIACVWWPLSLYSAWISVATIANIAAWLNGRFDIALETQFYVTLTMITVAFLVNLGMVHYRNMREFAMVGVWALVAIYVRYKDGLAILNDSQSAQIAYLALGLAALLAVFVGIHGIRNFKTNPFRRLISKRSH